MAAADSNPKPSKAPMWLIYPDGRGGQSLTLYTHEGEAIYVIAGFTSERAVSQFIALYMVLLVNAHREQAKELVDEYMRRAPVGPVQ